MLPTEKTPAKTNIEDFVILLYGKPKIGKTTFANGIEKTLFFATEAGLTGQDAYQVTINSWEDFLKYSKAMATEKHSFKTIAIDTIDNLYKFCAEWCNNQLGIVHQSDAGYGKGYDLINSEFLKGLTRLALLPTGLIMISHSKDETIKPRAGAEYTYSSPTLPGGARKIVIGMADIILYADTLPRETDKGIVEVRVLHTKPSTRWEAGGRIDWLPPVIELDYQKFIRAFKGDK